MQKTLIVLLLNFLCVGHSFAQLPPVRSLIPVYRGEHFVARFQATYGWHPSSFIIKANDKDGEGIGDYLNATCCLQENAYLHIYFGVQQSNEEEGKGDPILVIAGTKMAKNPYTRYRFLVHDNGPKSLWATTMHEPTGSVPFDCDFDFADRYDMDGKGLDYCSTGLIDRATAREYIKGFQYNDCNNSEFGSTRIEAESFIMSANDLREYLCKYPEVVYLQFYMAFRAESCNENLTILIAGLDKHGHHIWNYNDQCVPYMFGKGVPCPKCTVEYDASIDYHRQGAKQYRK